MANRTISTLLLSFVFLGCVKDDKVFTAPALEQNIIGSWTATMVSGNELLNNMEFSKDQSFKESSGLFFGNYDATKISWKVTGDSLTLTGLYTKFGPVVYGFNMITNNCNEITLDMEGLDILKLVRK